MCVFVLQLLLVYVFVRVYVSDCWCLYVYACRVVCSAAMGNVDGMGGAACVCAIAQPVSAPLLSSLVFLACVCLAAPT